MTGTTITAIEQDTNYLWKMKDGLVAAVAADDKEKIGEYREALLMLVSATDSKAVRIAAWRALAAAQTPAFCGPSDTVRPFVRRVVPIASAAVAAVMTACGFAASPSQVDPPEVAQMAVAYELPICVEWVDSCE